MLRVFMLHCENLKMCLCAFVMLLLAALTSVRAEGETYLEFTVLRGLISTHKDQSTVVTLPALGLGIEAGFIVDPWTVRLATNLQSGLVEAPVALIGHAWGEDREVGALLTYSMHTHQGGTSSKSYAGGPYLIIYSDWERRPTELLLTAAIVGTETQVWREVNDVTSRSTGFLGLVEWRILNRLARDVYVTGSFGARFEHYENEVTKSTGAGVLLGVGFRAFL